ncbi:unannotated protein [freshwater metagenome]|uniref:Unannotated protein n=1 Tax=freshwater metagenome TaxID=449393 RepID=A0A6J7EBU1_9ZZZZ|nr:hypothetical protein [Actinomycetota bacterium]
MNALVVLAGNLSGPGTYIKIPFTPIQISVGNLIVIAAMLVAFVAALIIPFPHKGEDQ